MQARDRNGRVRCLAFGALAWTLLPTLAAARNLIVNGTFDSDLSG